MPYVKIILLFVAVGAATQAGSLGMYYGIMYMIRNRYEVVNGTPTPKKKSLKQKASDKLTALKQRGHKLWNS
jgi:hypothetical protein